MFVSGLLVGVFAAPCVGPPVVALLAIVGAKGDPWFGFTSFFTLALGPRRAATSCSARFRTCCRRLPRSGEWMVWVKKVFGVVMVSLGVFYVLLAVAPLVDRVVPSAALVLGGLYLGFIDGERRPAGRLRALKWATGALAILAGVGLVAFAPQGRHPPSSRTRRRRSSRRCRAGNPRCSTSPRSGALPCHELERFTFSDARDARRRARFRTFRVDLTRYDSPEAERWRQKLRHPRRADGAVPVAVGDGGPAGARRGFLPPADFLGADAHGRRLAARAERE